MASGFIVAILFLGAVPRTTHPVPPPVLAVIVSRSQSVADLSLADFRRIYLGSMTRWPDGRRILPVVLPPRAVEERFFLQRALGMADIDYAQHWIGEIFRGRVAGPPYTASSSTSARRFVADHPDAIAFIDLADVDGSVRVLTIGGSSPGAPRYPLAP